MGRRRQVPDGHGDSFHEAGYGVRVWRARAIVGTTVRRTIVKLDLRP
jgi:hypothetical protein